MFSIFLLHTSLSLGTKSTLMNVAIIITAFNRRQKTIDCLKRLFDISHPQVSFKVFLTDDDSSDGTAREVSRLFPQVVLSHGNGSLFWAGGMNLSWKKAVAEGGFDGYLWLNDDTILLPDVWNEIIEADIFCRSKFAKGGIYAGATSSLNGSEITYGGSVTTSRWKSSYRMLKPDGSFQLCNIANGNVTFISHDVVEKIGCFYPGYIHGADYDYTYWAFKKGFPVLLLRKVVGLCDNDHASHKENLLRRNLAQRIKYLYAPNGMQLPTALLFQKRFYPWHYPLTFLSYFSKALFPWLIKE